MNMGIPIGAAVGHVWLGLVLGIGVGLLSGAAVVLLHSQFKRT